MFKYLSANVTAETNQHSPAVSNLQPPSHFKCVEQLYIRPTLQLLEGQKQHYQSFQICNNANY